LFLSLDLEALQIPTRETFGTRIYELDISTNVALVLNSETEQQSLHSEEFSVNIQWRRSNVLLSCRRVFPFYQTAYYKRITLHPLSQPMHISVNYIVSILPRGQDLSAPLMTRKPPP
jgi:hypothetical protein